MLKGHVMKRNRAGSAFAAASVAALCMSTGAAGETLQAVVGQALATHPELAAIRFNRHAIDHELTAARGLRLPSVDARTDYGRHRSNERNSLGIESDYDTRSHREVSVVMSQRLFDGFEARHEEARQKNRVESARWRVNDTANSIALRAVQAYLELQRAQAVLGAARSNLSAHQQLTARVSQRVDGGRGSVSDRSEAVGRTAQAQALVVEAEGRLHDAQTLFRTIVGRAPGQLAPVSPPTRQMPRTIDAAVAEARDAAPSILATEHDATAATAAIGVAQSRFYPRVNLELSSTHGANTSEDHERSTDNRAMLVVRWNLLNGGIDKARDWEAKARSLEAAEINQNTRRIIERETRTSWNAIATASGRVPALARQLEQNRLTRTAYASQFDAGQRRLLDLLNIQSEVFVAEASLRTEDFVRLYNTYRVLAAIGRLVPALGLELPEEAQMPHAPTVVDGWRDGWANWRTRVDYHREVDGSQAQTGGSAAKPMK